MSHWICLVQGKDGTGEPQLITLWETFLSKIKRVFHGFCKHSVGQNSATWSYNCKRSWEMYSSCVPKRNEGNGFRGNSQLSLPLDIKQRSERLKLVGVGGGELDFQIHCHPHSSAHLHALSIHLYPLWIRQRGESDLQGITPNAAWVLRYHLPTTWHVAASVTNAVTAFFHSIPLLRELCHGMITPTL